MKSSYKLTVEQIQAIEQTLNKGDRVEIIPVKDGAKILHINRKEITVDSKR